MAAVAVDALTICVAVLASTMAAVVVALLRGHFYAAHPYTWPILLWVSPVPAAVLMPWHRPVLSAATLLVASAIVTYAGVREFRRAEPRAWARSTSVRGEAGLIAFAGLIGGSLVVGNAVAGDVVGGVVLAVFVVVLVALGAEERSTRRQFDRLKTRVENLSQVERISDPDVRELVLGRCKGHEISIALLEDAIRISVNLPFWPQELMLAAQARAAKRDINDNLPTTGDVAFDSIVAIRGRDELWRPLLTAPVRAQLMMLLGDLGGTLDPTARRLTFVLPSGVLVRLDQAFNAAIELAGLMSSPRSDAKQRVLDLMRDEPQSAVRWSNYRWLVESSWNTGLVFRAAASDVDREIADWARAHVPPTDGAFR